MSWYKVEVEDEERVWGEKLNQFQQHEKYITSPLLPPSIRDFQYAPLRKLAARQFWVDVIWFYVTMLFVFGAYRVAVILVDSS